ncbi:MAG: hypothetical protein H7Y01_05055 [Ferruginibacter sp.]|nr:hypothetical protein [Chitinophagaceae bacterium]
MKTLILFLSVLAGGLSCDKGSAAEKDTVLPVITLTTPVNGQNFTAGQTIQITGNIADDKFIAEVHIHVTNSTTGALLMDVHIYPNASTATFNQSITAAAGINYKIQVIAKDRGVNEARVTADVSCN